MKTKLINAIRETIIDLETGRKHYEYTDCHNCNCGILAQNICHISAWALEKAFEPCSEIWEGAVRCSSTGEPLQKILKQMYSVGLTKKNIQNLEMLSDKKICKEAGIKVGQRYDDKKYLLMYLSAWLRILEREQPKEVKPEPEYRTVVIDSKVKELTQETISLS